VQDPIPTRPTDPANTSPRDPLTGNESHLTSLIHARLGNGEPEPVGRPRADALDALACGQTLCERLTTVRWVTAGEALAHGASAVRVAATLGLEIDEVAARRRSWAGGQHQRAGLSAAARDELRALLNDREAGR
jgi:hypothetical protein